MCQKRPGPRCAAHLRRARFDLDRARTESLRAFVAGEPEPHPDLSQRAARLQEEWDETRPGQADLAAQINALENLLDHTREDDEGEYHVLSNDHLLASIDDLRMRMLLAADRRAARVAAARSLEDGERRAASYQLTYGAHAHWLATATLPEQASPETLAVYRDYAVACTRPNTDGAPTEAVYEAPVTAGPRPGTWVVGQHVGRNREITDRMRALTPRECPNQEFQPVRPVLYDETADTVVGFDPDTGTTHGTPVPAASADAVGLLDHHGYLGATTGTVRLMQARVQVAETLDGNYLLRSQWTFDPNCPAPTQDGTPTAVAGAVIG